jgi:glycosyltransferase involved in cell wall biosynthesis
MSIEISVVICTYNRSHLVAQVLESIGGLRFAPERYEVIVVDNNSPDGTAEVVAESRARLGNVRYCLERRQGHSHARNRGWEEARGDYVAYLDDDCKVPADWLSNLAAVIAERRPAVCGGPALAFYDRPKPAWFRDAYGSFDLGGAARPLTRHFLYGMNIAFERARLAAIGGFNPAFGMVGGAIGYGDEIDPQRRLRALQPEAEIYYDPRLMVYHLVRPEKMTWGWTLRHRFANGQFAFRTFHGEDVATASYPQLARRGLLAIGGLASDLSLGLALRDRSHFPRAENYIYERALRHVERLGSLFEQFRQVSRRRALARPAQA